MTHATLSTDPVPGTDAAATDSTDRSETVGAADPVTPAEAEQGSENRQDAENREDSEPESDSDAESDAEDLTDPAGSDLQLAGGSLTDEELAAVTAVLGTLAGSPEVEHNGAGSAGPSDRTLQRRRRLGLWGRPGPDSWKHAAGLR
ncbi:hypothetical protein I2485_02750 [Nesterenkonia sp. E16_7]|uniref:acyl-CoA carboxylase epsilon subunit n=1 Tax=unclassified Nesterenkonia TaxID=2629769 RepID=UPI001A93A371|nr:MULTISPECIES: acyl-CoA carboxylase epsilon subunit [unclassified Nesterenkonia]MBO0594120.1 hypothetical protein [Nesterenkonia sp. E16_10]MBO0597566.1 hypothetical protein [Nesterenkonia sp. E16_7]